MVEDSRILSFNLKEMIICHINKICVIIIVCFFTGPLPHLPQYYTFGLGACVNDVTLERRRRVHEIVKDSDKGVRGREEEMWHHTIG